MRRFVMLRVLAIWLGAGVPILIAQTPIPLTLLQSEKPPKHLRPDWSDTQGRLAQTIQLNSTTIEEQIQIDRVVSYEVDATGKLDPNASFKGVVSKNAKLVVLACVTSRDPGGVGLPVTIHFTQFNGSPIVRTLTCALVSEKDRLREVGFHTTSFLVPTAQLHFGQPNFNPLTNGVTWKFHQLTPPTPGMNNLRYQVTMAPGAVMSAGAVIVHLFPYLQFGAIAPIVMIHGTAAQADSWLAPVYEGGTFDGQPGLVEPFVSPVSGSGYGFFALHCPQGLGGNPPPPPVPWFFGINLGTVYKPDGITVDLKKSGNAGILNSADQLQTLLRLVLDALGARRCHLIAHSKGGSDARAMFNLPILEVKNGFVPAGDTRRDILKDHYEVLSLTTIGTPHRGTPSASLAANLRWAVHSESASGDSGLDDAINADAATARKLQFFGMGPAGDALIDQVVGSPVLAQLNGPSSVDNFLRYTNRHFYSIVGDADLNADQLISFDEGKDFLPGGIAQSSAGQLLNYFASSLDSDYQLVGKVGTIDASLVRSNMFSWYIKLVPHPYDASQANLLWPNDLVTPLWSGIGPGATVLRLDPSVSGVPFTERGNLPSGYAGVLSGGNHSLLHRGQAAGAILQQIQADYPIQEPQ